MVTSNAHTICGVQLIEGVGLSNKDHLPQSINVECCTLVVLLIAAGPNISWVLLNV